MIYQHGRIMSDTRIKNSTLPSQRAGDSESRKEKKCCFDFEQTRKRDMARSPISGGEIRRDTGRSRVATTAHSEEQRTSNGSRQGLENERPQMEKNKERVTVVEREFIALLGLLPHSLLSINIAHSLFLTLRGSSLSDLLPAPWSFADLLHPRGCSFSPAPCLFSDPRRHNMLLPPPSPHSG
ncbi:hypothetical protein Ahy_A09g042928 isoform B [Arachis hypogaea]|uniref:Uncharacterized protein n=1 Tax=Arachis hypogaea TaxID=3818 RepID=A0A445BH66_ARAHY|nr:hypothetical protein Ahy_A09g042928 isoform B [Arachis hypogaea]